MKETITAGYVMANTKVKKLQLQGGIRYELTQVDSKEWDTRLNSEILAAGFPQAANGNPTTYAGMDYKYNSRPRVARHGEYHDYFPSFTAKYTIRPNLLADIGWGRTIKRPNIGLLSGVTQYNEELLEVRQGNPNLRPERSNKVVGAVSYFFGKNSSNNFSIVGSHNKIKDLVNEDRFTSEEFGNTDPLLDGWEFITSNNRGNPVTFRSLELSYLQYLTFLPRFLQGTSISASYTRTYASERRNGLVPHNLKGGVSYSYKRFRVGLNAVWRDDSPWNNNVRYLKANVKFDLNGSYRITDRVAFTFSGRNVTEVPHRIFETSAGNPDVLWRYENYGTNWTFGVSGTF
jgi:outer membrane cobalamin receptor